MALSWDGDGTEVPILSGISVNGTQVPGGSGSITLYGAYLTTLNAGVGTVNITGGITVTGYTHDTSSDPWLITITYQIPSGVTPGNYQVTITTFWGQSNGLVFQVQYGPPHLTCPSSVTRGGSITCSVGGAAAGNVTSWQFSGGGVTVTGPSGVLQWSGTMVVSGTVTVAVSPFSPVSGSITVNPRAWSTQSARPTEVNSDIVDAAGNTYTLPVPPQPGYYMRNGAQINYAGLAGTGYSLLQILNLSVTPMQIAGGPNNGFLYYPNPVSFGTHSFQSLINADHYCPANAKPAGGN